MPSYDKMPKKNNKKSEKNKDKEKSEIQALEHLELKNAKLELSMFTFCSNSSIEEASSFP
jgi:hypothetical protein